MLCIDIQLIAYIISVTLQLSGSLIVLFKIATFKRKQVVKNFFVSSFVSRNGNTDEIEYNEQAFREKFRESIFNIVAFAYLSLGYFFSIFGRISQGTEWIAVGWIVVTTLIVFFITNMMINLYVKHSYNVTKPVTMVELKENGIVPNVSSISNDEIDKICKDSIVKIHRFL